MKTIPSIKEIIEDVNQASRIAHGMLLYDLTAWLGTDAFAASGYSGAPIRGWLVTAESMTIANAWILGDLHTGSLGVVAGIRCDMEATSNPCTVTPDFTPRLMTSEERTMHRAIETAKSDSFFVESQESYNHIAVKGADYGVDAGWLVYLVASTTDPAVIPVGRHFRFDISSHGGKVLRRRASHRGVISPRRDDTPEKVVSVMNSAVFDAYPTEFQFYVSGLWKIEVNMLGCDGSLWVIDGLSARQLEPSAPGAQCPDPWSEER